MTRFKSPNSTNWRKKWKINSKSKTIWRTRTAKQRLLVSIELCLWASTRETRKYLHSSSTLRNKRGKNQVVGPEVFNLSGVTVTQAVTCFPCDAYVPPYTSRQNNVPQYLSFLKKFSRGLKIQKNFPSRTPALQDGVSPLPAAVIWALPLADNASAAAAFAKPAWYFSTADVKRSGSTISFWRLFLIHSLNSAQNNKNHGAATSESNNSVTELIPFAANPGFKEHKNSTL